tara:strand:- start:228 stop:2012 length:1785 start_codon:yes stop_codon:yes gene_type:complete
MESVRNILDNTSNIHRQQLTETKAVVGKWMKTGLLEGLDNDYEKHGMAVLLENQAKQLIDESSRTGTSSNAEEWSGVALPLVRRIFAEIAAKDFVSVQPMNLPSGLIFYLDYKYGTSVADFKTAQGRTSQKDSVFGETNQSDDPTEGLYGAGRYGYTNKYVETAGAKTDDGAAHAGGSPDQGISVTTASLRGVDYNFNTVFSQSYAGQFHGGTGGNVAEALGGKAVARYYFATSSIFTDADGSTGHKFIDKEAVRAFQLTHTSGSTVTSKNFKIIEKVFSEFTKLTDSSGNEKANGTFIQFVVSGSGASSQEGYKVQFIKTPTDITRGDFETTTASTAANPEVDLAIPEINLEMRSIPIVAKTRKLKAVWTPEFAQDLNAYHSIDAEAELTSMLSEYISQEIDLEILDMLQRNALTTERWSVTIGEKYDGNNLWIGANTGEAYNQGLWFQTLGTKIQKVSNKIHQKTMRGGANWLVCSPDVATVLESIPGYAANTDGNSSQFAMGVQKVGQLNNRFTVYKNPYMVQNTILMGFRGTQFLETGAVYAPYVPLIMTPLVYDPKNFTPRKGVMTRYAKKIVRPEFYGKIEVKGLHTL